MMLQNTDNLNGIDGWGDMFSSAATAASNIFKNKQMMDIEKIRAENPAPVVVKQESVFPSWGVPAIAGIGLVAFFIFNK